MRSAGSSRAVHCVDVAHECHGSTVIDVRRDADAQRPIPVIGPRLEERRRIALVAHDNKKQDLLDWAFFNREILEAHTLLGTGTTGALIARELGLEVELFKSGPLGGDQQLGARISEGEIDLVLSSGIRSSRSRTTPMCAHCCASPSSGTFRLRAIVRLLIT